MHYCALTAAWDANVDTAKAQGHVIQVAASSPHPTRKLAKEAAAEAALLRLLHVSDQLWNDTYVYCPTPGCGQQHFQRKALTLVPDVPGGSEHSMTLHSKFLGDVVDPTFLLKDYQGLFVELIRNPLATQLKRGRCLNGSAGCAGCGNLTCTLICTGPACKGPRKDHKYYDVSSKEKRQLTRCLEIGMGLHCTKTILKASLKSLTIKVPRLLWRKSPVYFIKAPRTGRKSPRKSF
jgi:hypothetical protein